uniref:Uncharacterized protein n=1 Tax=Oryza nivara TaxID=4536 RepID=A0A0E0IUV0_ORYNI
MASRSHSSASRRPFLYLPWAIASAPPLPTPALPAAAARSAGDWRRRVGSRRQRVRMTALRGTALAGAAAAGWALPGIPLLWWLASSSYPHPGGWDLELPVVGRMVEIDGTQVMARSI